MTALVICVFAIAETLKDVIVDSDTYQKLSDKAIVSGTTPENIASDYLALGIQKENEANNIELARTANRLLIDCKNQNKLKECVQVLTETLG